MRHDHVKHIRGAAQEDDYECVSTRGSILRCEGQARHPGFLWVLD